MDIGKKLTFQFMATVALILMISFIAIYLSFSGSRKSEFYDRLDSKAKLAAQMLIDIDEIDAELLLRIERNNPLSLPNEILVIFDYRNNKIFTNDDNNVLFISPTLISEVRVKKEVRYNQKPYEVLGQYYTGKDDRIVVFAAATDIFGLRKISRLRNILIFVFIASLILVYLAGKSFSARALLPISRIINQVDEIGISNLDARVDEGNRKDELARLAITFNKMLHRLESAFNNQKRFIANASHELKNPLTAITGQLEVTLMKDERSPEEYRKTIVSVHEDIVNLNRMANNLLLLAQTNTDSTSKNFTPVRIDELLWKAEQEIRKRNTQYHIHINFNPCIEDESSFTVLGNEMLLRVAMTNLIDNACKYSSDHTVEIMLNVQADFPRNFSLC